MEPTFQPDGLFVIAGPCVIESAEQCMTIAEHVLGLCRELGIGFVFKASFDKANRSSAASFRGPGMEKGLATLAKVRRELGVCVLTDVHEPQQAAVVGQVVDIVQVPAFLARQTDLLAACGKTGKWVNIKKGQFMAPQEMANAVAKVTEAGNPRSMLTERGTFFGYNRLVNDFTGLAVMKQMHVPVVFDVTHSTQQPGGLGHASGGNSQYSPMLARAAVAAGVDGLFIECHPDPARALSDATTVLPLTAMQSLLTAVKQIHDLRVNWS